jgi:hypothetical protein
MTVRKKVKGGIAGLALKRSLIVNKEILEMKEGVGMKGNVNDLLAKTSQAPTAPSCHPRACRWQIKTKEPGFTLGYRAR